MLGNYDGSIELKNSLKKFYKKMKKIAVITSVYNGQRYIKNSINSVLKNDSRLFDYFVLDNGSTDRTPIILNKFKNNKNLFILKNSTVLPRTVALNQLTSKLRKKYHFFINLDADDILEKNWIEDSYNFIKNRKNISVLSGQFYLINSNNEIYKKSNIPIYPKKLNKYFSYTFPVVHSGLLIRFKHIKRKNIYNEKLIYGHDWDLCINLAIKGSIVSINKSSVYFRHHPDSLTKNLSNQLQSKHDKLQNLRSGRVLANDFFSLLKNKNREGSEIFSISYTNYKKKNFLIAIKFFMLGLFTFPFSIFLNNKIISLFYPNRIFTYRVKKCKI